MSSIINLILYTLYNPIVKYENSCDNSTQLRSRKEMIYDLKAMIMAAGVGSRLDPLTKFVPKPLVPIANKPVMDILLEYLHKIGVKSVISNTHYMAEKIIDRYSDNSFGINFNYIKEENLSGTAGGLKKCQYFFNEGENFIVLSGDGVSNADLLKGINIHKSSDAIATIGIKQIPKNEVSHFGVVVTDEEGFITEFQEKPSLEEAKSNFINTGIYIFNYKIFDYIPANTFYDFAKNVFPDLLVEKQINTFEITEYWSDIGTLGQYRQSTQDLFNKHYTFAHAPIIKTSTGAYISSSVLPMSTKFIGNSTIGSGCIIGKNVTLKNCIIWDNVTIGDNVTLDDCVIASNTIITRDLIAQNIAANQEITGETVNI